jgi:hypothetical protein
MQTPFLGSIGIPSHKELAAERKDRRKKNQRGKRIDLQGIPALQNAGQKYAAVSVKTFGL